MTTLLLVLGVAAGVVLSAFVSAIETGSYCLNRVRLRVRSEQNRMGARRLSRLIERQDDLLMSMLLGNSLADYCATACLTALLAAAVSETQAGIYATLILTPMLLIFGGIIPKDWFRREADRWMYLLALPVEIGVRIAKLTGAVWSMRRLSRFFLRRIDPLRKPEQSNVFSRANMLRLLHEGAAHGGLSAFQQDTIERVLQVSQVRVTSIMTPLRRAAMLPANVSREDLLRVARMAHFARLPLYQGEHRRVVGIVNVYDVIMDEKQQPISAYMRPPLTVRSDETVPTALLKLQQTRQVMAIVADSAGNAVGLFTLKDLVEEIVGELEVW